MTSDKKTARIAGLLFLGIVVTRIFKLMYVPKILIIWDNTTTTFNNITNNKTLYRLGITSSLLSCTFCSYIVLYKIFKTS